MTDYGYIGAFLGGMFAFLSPCILPLIPSYVSFITGISFEDFKTGETSHIRKLTIINSSAFILGFTIVFIFLGVTTSYIGSLLGFYKDEIRIIGGIIAIFFGLYIMGFFKFRFLAVEHRLHLKSKPRGFIGSFIIGLTFAGGWTPCIGPIIGSIASLTTVAGSVAYGFKLMIVFSLGLAIPFMLTSLAINTFVSYFVRIQRYMRVIMILSGLLLISFGVVMLTDNVYLLFGLSPSFGLEEFIKPK